MRDRATEEFLNGYSLEPLDEESIIYSSLLKKDHVHECIVFLQSLKVVNNAYRRINANIAVNALAIDMVYSSWEDTLSKDKRIILTCPAKTFVRMFNKKGVDLRKDYSTYRIRFKIQSNKVYEIVQIKKEEDSDKTKMVNEHN